MGRNVARKLGSFVLSLTAGCGLFGGEDDPSFSISASTTTAVIQQGTSTPITLEIARTNFEKPIQLAIEGTLPAGVTASFAQNPVSGSSGTTTLTIAAAGSATPGTAALTIKATGEGLAEKAVLIDVTVNVRGTHTVALTQGAMNVAQGGGGQSTVLLARQNNNAGNVTLIATGAPSGMTVTFGESPTTSSATSVTVAATGAVATGTYNITITGAQPGVTPNPTPATLAVTVISAPATTSISLPFCAAGVPVWFAYQNDGFLWQRVTATGNAFTFNATDKLAIAFVFQNGSESDTRFYFGTRSELSGFSDRNCTGPKTHSGSIANIGAAGAGTTPAAFVSVGPELAAVSSGNSYVLEGVPDRALDLVATRGQLTSSFLYTPDRIVVRRGVNLANNATVPLIDFLGSESVATTQNTLTIGGLDAGEEAYSENVFFGATETVGFLCSSQSAATVRTFCSAPASVLGAGDVHELYIDAFTQLTSHTMVSYYAAPGDRTETLGPNLSIPTVTTAGSSPYLRERGQLGFQTAYNTAARFVFLQGVSPARKFVVAVITNAYMGGTAASGWDVSVPDVSGVTGFNTSWMHAAGQSTAYSAEAFSAPGNTLFGGVNVAGDIVRFAYRQSSFTPSASPALRAVTLRPRSSAITARELLNPPPQYFRR